MTLPLDRPGQGHDEAFEELAAGAALSALDPPDDARFRDHLPGCARCQSLLRDYRQVAASLPETLDELEASPDLRRRILDRAAAERTDSAAAAPAVAPAAPRAPRRIGPSRWGWALPLAALFAVTLGLGYWNHQLRQQLAEQAAALQVQQRALTAVAGGGQRWELAGTDQAPGASAVVIQGPDGSPAYLVVRDLPALPPDRTYQAWVIAGGAPAPAGLLDSPRDGPAVAQLERPFSPGDTVAVTIEPAGGRTAPSGPIVVAGQV